MKKIEKYILKRTFFVLLILLFVFILIISSLFNLQILENQSFQNKVIEQMTVETKVNPNRGEIYDRNGNILVSNKTVWILYAIPKNIKNPKFISENLSKILGFNEEIIYSKISQKNYKYQIINNAINEEKTNELRRYIDENNLSDCLQLVASATRYYPYESLASHTLGFVNADGIGIYGLEKTYNNILEGKSGKYITSQDAQSNEMPFQYEIYINNEESYNMVSTIDLYIQYQLEAQLKLAATESGAQNRATGIVMDPQNGEILAMAVYPYFDLNNPYELDLLSKDKLSNYVKGTAKYKNEYLNLLYSMWNNKAVTELYEPGSTFKLVTTAIALQEKVAKTTDMFNCSGSLKVDGFYRAISCHKKTGHGSLNFKQALQQSCNPSMMNLAFRIGKEKFYQYFIKFGYTTKTGIDLPSEAQGVYHNYKDFSNVSLAVYSFGQTFKTTAIQQLCGISAVANGGYLVKPHLLKEIVDTKGKTMYEYEIEKEKIIDSEVSATISQILKEGVDGDGGAKNAYVLGYDIAAKTGTSEKKDKYDEKGNTPYRVSSCVGYAPSDNPKVAAIILVDEPTVGSVYGSVVAAPYISNLMELILPYLGEKADYSEEDISQKQVVVPNLEGISLEKAIEILKLKGISYEIKGTGTEVLSQMPTSNQKIFQKNGKVILYTANDNLEEYVTVPDVINKDAEKATKTLVEAGFNINIIGNKNYKLYQTSKVIYQSIESGMYLPKGSIVTIEIAFSEDKD